MLLAHIIDYWITFMLIFSLSIANSNCNILSYFLRHSPSVDQRSMITSIHHYKFVDMKLKAYKIVLISVTGCKQYSYDSIPCCTYIRCSTLQLLKSLEILSLAWSFYIDTIVIYKLESCLRYCSYSRNRNITSLQREGTWIWHDAILHLNAPLLILAFDPYSTLVLSC